jgi:uncharacterized protein (TIRG00374 family)
MKQRRFNMDWRRWLLLAILAALTVWVFSRFAGIKDLVTTLSQGIWTWVLVGVALHAIFFVMNAQLYSLGFATVGVKGTAWQLLPVLFGALFANVILPSGGAAGGALFIGDAVRRGQSGARAAVGALLAVLADLYTLIPFIAFGVAFLASQHALHGYDTAISIIFVVFIAFPVAGLFLARLKPDWLKAALGWIRRPANRIGGWFKHPNLLGDDWAQKNAEELSAAAGAIVAHPVALGRTLAWAFLMHVVNLAGLYALFLAFEQPVQLGTLVAGFAMGIVVWVVAIVPQGIAAVEGVMSLVFTSMGIAPDKTVAIVLAYRGVNFYLPLIFGFFLLRYVSGLGRENEPDKERRTDAEQPLEEKL